MDTYEKKYKEALSWMKSLYDGLHGATKKDAEHYFPELKESDDEKIRKWLIGYFNQYIIDGMPQVFSNGLNVKDVIAWLEKQHIQKQEISYPKFDFDDILALQCCMETAEKVTEDKELYKKLQSLHSRLHDAYWLEKQGEQKQDPCDNCKDVRLNCHNFPCTKKKAFEQGKSVLEVIKEEPQVYKTEDGEIITHSETDGYKLVGPKFHEGDWIIHQGTENIYQVVAVIDNQYQLKYGDNYTVQKCADVDRCARLWDITKDAKDGDVLVIQETDFTYESIFIFNKIENDHIIQYLHYFITDKGEEVCKAKSVGCFLGFVGDNVHPATKEQRDKLKKAMADAGYTFDFNKKKLKKIEQKPAWSEEDEIICAELIKFFEAMLNCLATEERHNEKRKWLNWLKSIKEKIEKQVSVDKIEQKPTWKPSDEQIKAVRLARNFVTDDFVEHPTLSEILIELEKQLRKLK